VAQVSEPTLSDESCLLQTTSSTARGGACRYDSSKGRALETARSLWQRQYQESNRADVRDNAMNHLLSIQVAEDLRTLELFIGKYLKIGRSGTKSRACISAVLALPALPNAGGMDRMESIL
jgi:hypothetical protein